MILALVARATGKKYKAMARIVAQNPTYTQVSSRDGRWIQLLGLETPRHLGKLLKALGIDEAVKADPRFAPVGDKYLNLISRLVAEVPLRKEFNSTVDKAVKLKDAAEWVDIFKAGDVWHELAEDVFSAPCTLLPFWLSVQPPKYPSSKRRASSIQQAANMKH